MNTTKYKFHKLTPVKDTELKIYADSLDYVFDDDDLKNIAITGPYSSGKSSMIETYKAENKERKFIHISLAHFETATDTSTDPSDNEAESGERETKGNILNQKSETDIKEVEGKILNQLIHQIDAEKIPQTHFKIKRPFIASEAAKVSAIITVVLALLMFLFNKGEWIEFVNKSEPHWFRTLLGITTMDWFVTGAIGVCIWGVFYGVFGLLKIQHNKNLFRKFSIQGNELEIFEKDEDSFFDRHLNEVLYLFRHTDADAIVFEDMDRYNSNQIFEKLREINYLLNNSAQVREEQEGGQTKIFRFFYLLRDDIFTSKDRTKFFDFIIPIVPVIDGANSYDKFIKYFKDGDIFDSFDKEFLQEISTYIDDMRLLKNIYNEYRIYHNRIQSTELNPNKLLGMIAYKNLFPRDFSELQVGKGFVFFLFSNKKRFIEMEINIIDKHINEIEVLITNANQEHLKDLDELDALFLDEKKLIFDVNGQESSVFSTRGEFIRAMKADPDEVYASSSLYGTNRYRSKIDIMAEFEQMLSVPEYVERKSIVEAKTTEKKKQLYDELRELRNRRKVMESATLSEIIQSDKEVAKKVFSDIYIDEINIPHKYEDVKGSLYFPLIKYLLRNKYIDENYPDYMSYFYAESISRSDQIFVRSVFDEEAKAYTYPLKDAALVASKISPRYYSKPETLNYALFTYLLHSQNTNLAAFLEQLRGNKRIDFIVGFWETGSEKRALFVNINKVWPTIWCEMAENEMITIEDKNKYLIETFYYSSHDDLQSMNVNNVITEYINSCANFLNVQEPEVPLIVDALEFLIVKFDKLNYDVSDRSLFDMIYSRNLYKINKEMVFLILNKVYQIPEVEDYYHKNYSLIMTRPQEALAVYIDQNMDSYLDLIMSICKGEIKDNEEYVLKILNHPNIEQEQKERYIGFLVTEIEELTSLDDISLWSILLASQRVAATKLNILNYYFDTGNAFDNALTHFINVSTIEKGLKYNDVLKQYGKENTSAFYKNLITNNELKNDKYAELLRGFERVYESFKFTSINNDKIEILIGLNIIKMNKLNLDFVRENYETCTMAFISANINEYAQRTINEENFELSELECLLRQKISNRNILKLIGFTNEPISIADIKVSDAVKKHIIENNYFKDDLYSLTSGYEKASQEIKQTLFDLCKREVDYIIEKSISLPFVLLIELIKLSNIANKDELVAVQLEDLEQEQAIECLEALNMNDLLTAFEGKWPLVTIDATSTKILGVMESKRWISSFVVDEDKPDCYRVRARRNIEKQNTLPDHLL